MDSSSARIHIGGTLNLYGPPPGKKRTWANSIRLFISLISDYGPDGDIGTPKHNVNPDRPMSLRRAAKEKGVIICEDHEAAGGEFEQLEEVCRDLGLPYDRWSDGTREYPGQYTRYRPGWIIKEPFTVEANNEAVPVVDRDPVLEAYGLLRDKECDESFVADAKRVLERALYTGDEEPVEPHRLPPFKVSTH